MVSPRGKIQADFLRRYEGNATLHRNRNRSAAAERRLAANCLGIVLRGELPQNRFRERGIVL
jgi:hypothetical protein